VQVPQREFTFIERLIGTEDEVLRKAALLRAFSEDWEEAAPREIGDDPDKRLRELAGKLMAKKTGQATGPVEAPDVVRPGRFMLSLRAIREQLNATGGEDNPAGAIPKKSKQTLEVIYGDAIFALEELAQGKG